MIARLTSVKNRCEPERITIGRAQTQIHQARGVAALPYLMNGQTNAPAMA